MSEQIAIDLAALIPPEKAVLLRQGFSEDSAVSDKAAGLLEQALQIVAEKAKPVGVLVGIENGEFADIYEGSGQNSAEAPLAQIFPKADSLALFAITLGSGVSAAIEDMFKRNDFALGAFVDSAASLAAEAAVDLLEEKFLNKLLKQGASAQTRVLSYSPGYCGWHISAQAKLFEQIGPGTIDITLNDSYLMSPLKSVSGILVAGAKEIHQFENSFSFCHACKECSCRERIAAVMAC